MGMTSKRLVKHAIRDIAEAIGGEVLPHLLRFLLQCCELHGIHGDIAET